jgi:CubicO group peptidase (beta-lactamase class C family)
MKLSAGLRATIVLPMLVALVARAVDAQTRADDSVVAVLDARVPALLAQHHVPSIAIASIRDGAVVWTKVYGEQAAGVPATARTLYNVASLTKPVFAEIIVRLAAAGRVSLDEPLAGSWIDPDVAADPRHRALTPRMALSHRTGFPNWRPSNAPLRFTFEPGSGYGYSGEGFMYMARFAERKLGASLDALGRDNVFAPLGMTNTAFTQQPWFTGRVALPADRDGTFEQANFSATGNAADLLYTTIGDYAAFAVGVMNRTGLPAAYATQRDSIHSVDLPALTACRSKLGARCPERIGYALGWQIFEYPGFTVRWHTGSDDGHKSVVFYFPEQRRGAVMLTNGANGFLPMMEIGTLLARDTPFADYIRSGGE